MAAPSEADIVKVLEKIRDPASGRNVVEAGLIDGIALRGRHASFTVEVPASRGASAEPLRKACEDAVGQIPGILTVTAVLTAHRERNARATAAPARTHTHGHGPTPAERSVAGVKAIIAVASGKGGVGKSTVSVNLALGLAALGLKTGLLDCDIYGPSVPRLLGITEKPRMIGNKLLPIEKFGLKAMSIGFLVEEDKPMIWRGPMVQSAITQMLSDVDWAPLDVLVVDMPPGTGDAQLTLAQRVPLKGAVIVSTPQDLALIDARKALAMFRRTEVPVLGIVENMSVFVCPHCGQASHIFGHGGARQVASQLGCDFLGEIPLVPSIRETSDAGTPVVATAPLSPEAQAFSAVAQRVAAKLEVQDTRSAPKIVFD
jgi:ATP-binding protein involved in chromosome partitioning